MMSDYDRTLELQEAAYNSVGQSTIQFNKYQDTVEYKINQIKNSWERLRVSLIDQNTYTKALDIGNQLLSSIKKDFNVKDLAFIGVIGLTIGRTFITQMIKGIQTNLTGLTNTLNSFKSQIPTILSNTGKYIKDWASQRIPIIFEAEVEVNDPTQQEFIQSLQNELTEKLATATTAFNNLSSAEKELFTINGQPIPISALASLQNALGNTGSVSDLTERQINELYHAMGNTGIIRNGTLQYQEFVSKLITMQNALKTDTNEMRNFNNTIQDTALSMSNINREMNQFPTNIISRLGNVLKPIGSAISNSIGTAITTGVTTYIATGDLEKSLEVSGQTLMTSVISMLIPKIVDKLLSMLLTAVLANPAVAIIGVAIAGIIVGSIATYKYWARTFEPLTDALEEELDTIDKKIDSLSERIETATSTAFADKKAVTSMEELKKEFDDLNNKISLTAEEQERYNEIIQEINEQYPDTISYYDEMTNKLVINERLWSQQLEEAKQIAELSQIKSINLQSQKNIYEVEKAETNAKLSQEKLLNNYGIVTEVYSSKREGENAGTKTSAYVPESIIDVGYDLGYEELTNKEKEKVDFIFQTIYDYLEETGVTVTEDYEQQLKEEYRLQTENFLNLYTNALQTLHPEFDEEQKQLTEANQQYIKSIVAAQEETYKSSIANTEGLIESTLINDTIRTYAEISIQERDSEEQLKIKNETLSKLSDGKYGENEEKDLDDLLSTISDSSDFETLQTNLGLTSDVIEEITGITSDNFDTMTEDMEDLSLYIQENLYNRYITEKFKEEIDNIPQGLIDNFTELSETASNMTIAEYQNVINQLKSQYGNNINNIESGASSQYQNFANMFITQNDEGQITGGLFSNLFKDTDIASQFTEAMQNGDFSTAQMLLVDNLSDDGKLFADILMNTDPATISSINSFIADNFTGDEAQAKAQVGFQELLKKMTTGEIDLEDNELSILLNSGIDFSTNNPLADDTIMKQAAESLESASNGALSYEEALQKVQNVYPKLIQIVGEFQYGSESAFNTLISGSQTASEELKKQSDALFTILDDYNTTTGLTREQINQLNEVGLQDIYKLSKETGTMILDLSNATEIFSNNTEKTAKALQEELTIEKRHIAQLEQQKERMNALGQDTTEITKQINEANKSYQDHTLQAQQEISLSYQESISYLQKYIDWLKNLQDAADEAQEALKKAQEEQQKAQKELNEIQADLPNKIAEAYKEEAEAIKEAQEAAEDAYESLQDAYDSLQDAQEALADANKELYEAIHGTEDYTTGLERMYNASRRIDTIDKRLENLKETMENATNSNDIVKATEDYINMAKEKVNVLTAMNQADQQTLNNMMNDFLNNSSYDALKQFFKQTENGIEIDMQGIENADANDEIKNAAIEWAEQYNEIFDNILDRNDEISEAQKIMKDYYKTALDGYVSLQEKVADILKENAEEEISITEEKYASMKEADDAYLDALESAINKQRELREQANKYEDLATQEKKLALLSRDTSGANQKQVLELQQEVETSRTEILDAEIDNFLESMRELYETQQEARDTEIEYLNALMESTNWWTKTNELLNSFESADDYKAWLMENDTSFGDMSVEQQEQYLMEAETDYNAIPQFDAAKIMMEQWGQDLSAMIQADVNEVNRIVNELGIDTAIGSQILTAGEVARDEMIKTAEESVASAEQAVIEAQQNVLDMEVAYQEAMDNITTVTKEAAEEREKAIQDAYQEEENAAQALKDANDTLRDAEIEATTAANNLQNALGDTATTAAEAIANINNSIVTLQNDCVRYIQDLANGNLSEASNRYYISTQGLDAIGTINKVQDAFGVSIPSANVLTGEEADNFVAQYGQWFHEAGYDITTHRYAQGGMVDYTGPAWVDGSKSKPEAFLDPEDTQNIAELTAVLSSQKSSSVPFAREMISAASSFGNILYPALSSIPTSNNISNISTTNNSTATSTNVEVHINVDSIASDYDVEQMLNVVEQRIYEVSNPVGSSVILQK